MEDVLIVFFGELGQTFAYLWREVSQIEGDSLKEVYASAIEQFQHDHTRRVLWLLIAALILSAVVFVLCASMALFEAIAIRPHKRKKHPIKSLTLDLPVESAKESDEKLSETIGWAKKVAPRSVIDKLKAGEIRDAEKSLLAECKKNPQDDGLIIYLLACRAMQADAKSYDTLIEKIFPEGLTAEKEVCRHAAELGRLLSPDKYPISEIPQPETVFELEEELVGDTLGPISEFGSVQTLLDLIRVYFEMGDTDQTRHLIVEVLICGNAKERELALNYAKLIGI